MKNYKFFEISRQVSIIRCDKILSDLDPLTINSVVK